jgi:hypothetical protein
MSMKNSNDTVGNRTRNLPVYSAVPQPTAPPRAPLKGVGSEEKGFAEMMTLYGNTSICDYY